MYKKQSAKNSVVIASAGSRKTTGIVEEAIGMAGKRVLITTYTNENLDQIREYIVERCGHVPKHIVLLSWYSFLLQDAARPYQNLVLGQGRIQSILFDAVPAALRYVPKSQADKFFLTRNGQIYRDRVSEFACLCDERCGGAVIKRLEKIYGHIFIDEFQDLAGYDLIFLEKIFNSSISVRAVGDPRQGTFSTNNSRKNAKYKKDGVFDWADGHKKTGLIAIDEWNECFRSNQMICDFADGLFPSFIKTVSKNAKTTGHDGIFQIKSGEVPDYVARHTPAVLRWNKSSSTMNLPAVNIGVTKGRTYERVLIFPTGPMKEYLKSNDLSNAGDLPKLYVAVTRAKYSVAFVMDAPK